MRILILLFFGLCFFEKETQAQASVSTGREQLAKINWLLGEWTRTNVKPGRTAFEKWEQKSDTEFSGVGITMREKDTAFVEKLKIVVKDNELFYVADVPGNKQPIYFKITTLSDAGFVCENPAHDFPKMIAYKRQGNKMTATISGNGKAFDYLFEHNPKTK
jgi:hypothetical protein